MESLWQCGKICLELRIQKRSYMMITPNFSFGMVEKINDAAMIRKVSLQPIRLQVIINCMNRVKPPAAQLA
jgi:hypothetical protein